MTFQSRKGKNNILQEVEKELKEDAEGIDLVKADVQGLAAMINDPELDIKMFDDAEYNIRDIVKNTIENTSSLNSFFLIDIGALFRRYKLWKKNLSRVEMFYAVKCNPDKVILRTLADLGVGFDVASKDEITMVKDLNVTRDMIIFANPIKEASHISYAESENVSMMTFDNIDELKGISKLHPKAKLVLRILVDDSKSIMPFGAKFGCPKQNVRKVLSLAKTLKLKIIGVSFHVGSCCLDATAYSDAIAYARRVFDLASTYGFKMNLLDIGGGFPGFNTPESDEHFITIAKVVNNQLDKSFSDVPNLRVIAEPGRFFATSCGTLATNVIGRKILRDEHGKKVIHYFVNSNMYGLFNNLVFDNGTANFHLLKDTIKSNQDDKRSGSKNVDSDKHSGSRNVDSDKQNSSSHPTGTDKTSTLKRKASEMETDPNQSGESEPKAFCKWDDAVESARLKANHNAQTQRNKSDDKLDESNDASDNELEEFEDFDDESDDEVDDESEGTKLFKSVIYGQTCDSKDKIADNVMLPELVCGNWIYVTDWGAYTIASASRFNGMALADTKYVFFF
jgi:diaminopimelate decarboxylase